MPQPPGRAKLPAMMNMPHADVVGSLIRPPELLAAREGVAAATERPPIQGTVATRVGRGQAERHMVEVGARPPIPAFLEIPLRFKMME